MQCICVAGVFNFPYCERSVTEERWDVEREERYALRNGRLQETQYWAKQRAGSRMVPGCRRRVVAQPRTALRRGHRLRQAPTPQGAARPRRNKARQLRERGRALLGRPGPAPRTTSCPRRAAAAGAPLKGSGRRGAARPAGLGYGLGRDAFTILAQALCSPRPDATSAVAHNVSRRNAAPPA